MIKTAWISRLFRGIWMYPAGGFNREANAHSEAASEEIYVEDKTLRPRDRETSSCEPEQTELAITLGLLA